MRVRIGIAFAAQPSVDALFFSVQIEMHIKYNVECALLLSIVQLWMDVCLSFISRTPLFGRWAGGGANIIVISLSRPPHHEDDDVHFACAAPLRHRRSPRQLSAQYRLHPRRRLG